MRRVVSRAFNTASKIKIPNQEAFDFLPSCLDSKFDLTSVDSISPAPKHILRKTLYSEDLYTEDLLQYEHFSGFSKGDPSVLKECLNFANRNKIECGINNVSLNHGVLSSISKILRFVKPDRVLLPVPTFGYYFQQLKDHNIDFEIISTKKENNFLLDSNTLEVAAKKPGKKILLLCCPNNPTGAVMTEKNAKEISDVAIRNDLTVLSDEDFSQNLLSNNEKHFSIISVPGMLERSIAFFGISKMMGIPIKNIGFCIGSENLIKYFSELGGYGFIDSKIIAEILRDSDDNQDFFTENKKKYLQNIELVKDKISELNQKFGEIFGEEKIGADAYVKPYISDPKIGGPYLLDFSGLRGKTYNGRELETGLDIAKFLLGKASVGTVPGECFMFSPDDMLVRISLSKKPEILNQAFDSIIDNVSTLSNTPSKNVAALDGKALSGEHQNQRLN